MYIYGIPLIFSLETIERWISKSNKKGNSSDDSIAFIWRGQKLFLGVKDIALGQLFMNQQSSLMSTTRWIYQGKAFKMLSSISGLYLTLCFSVLTSNFHMIFYLISRLTDVDITSIPNSLGNIRTSNMEAFATHLIFWAPCIILVNLNLQLLR